jgi:hypothetical protein
MSRIVMTAAMIQTISKGKIQSLALKFRPMFILAAEVLDSSRVVPLEAPPKNLPRR